MNLYKNIKHKIKILYWMYMYSSRLGVPGIRVKYNFYSGTSKVIPYKYLLRFMAKQIAKNHVLYGPKDALIITSDNWFYLKMKLHIPVISIQMLEHLFSLIQYNKISTLDVIAQEETFYVKYYRDKRIEIESI